MSFVHYHYIGFWDAVELGSGPRATRALTADEVSAVEREVACRYGRVSELAPYLREDGLLVLGCSRRSDFEAAYFCARVAHELFGAMLAERVEIPPAEVRDGVACFLAQNAEVARIRGLADERERVAAAVRAITPANGASLLPGGTRCVRQAG